MRVGSQAAIATASPLRSSSGGRAMVAVAPVWVADPQAFSLLPLPLPFPLHPQPQLRLTVRVPSPQPHDPPQPQDPPQEQEDVVPPRSVVVGRDSCSS